MAGGLSRTALLVIDMQRDFIDDTSPIRVAGGKTLVPNIVEAVQVCRNHGALVVWFLLNFDKVVREHDPLGRDVEQFRRHFYAPGKAGAAVKGSAGAELVDQLELVMEQDDYKLVKTRFSTHLHSVLEGLGKVWSWYLAIHML
uniref:Isochorismatase-like domain-containing protein n=1 Tax=Kalanchoe fedtschenkoi TaxID=63787 RepID=A0A7N0VK22_KALFE